MRWPFWNPYDPPTGRRPMPIGFAQTSSGNSSAWHRSRAGGCRHADKRRTASMKCPKCGYLGFEHVERCRNCGYDFSFAPAQSLPELSIRNGDAEDENTFDDLTLVDAASPRGPSSSEPRHGSAESGSPVHRRLQAASSRSSGSRSSTTPRSSRKRRRRDHRLRFDAPRLRCLGCGRRPARRCSTSLRTSEGEPRRCRRPLGPIRRNWPAKRSRARRARTRVTCRPRRGRRDRSADSCRHRCGRRLLHDADLRADVRRFLRAAQRRRSSRSCSCRTAAIWWRSRSAARRLARWPPASGSCRLARKRPSIWGARSSERWSGWPWPFPPDSVS